MKTPKQDISLGRQVAEDVGNALSVALLLLFSAVLPIFLKNGYVGLTEAKTDAFRFPSLWLLPLSLLLILMAGIGREIKWVGRKPVLLLPLLLGIEAVISSLLSGDFQKSFWGYDGWGVGGFAWLALAFFGYILIRFFRGRRAAFIPLWLSAGVILILGILNSAGVDVGGIHQNIAAWQYYHYITTVGNIDWYAGYLCLFMPFLMIRFLYAEGKERWALAFLWVLGSANVLLCGSDGVYLGLGVAAFFGIPAVLDSRKKAEDGFLLVGLYGLSVSLCAFLPFFDDKWAAVGSTLSTVMRNPILSLSVALVGTAGFLLFRYHKGFASPKIRKGMMLGMEVGLGLFTLVLLIKTVVDFNDDWGNRRGLIWKFSLKTFESYSFKQKLFGAGPGMLREVLNPLKESFSMTVLSVHSEPLQILLTLGILGLSLWIAFLVCCTVLYIKKRAWQGEAAAGFLSYMAFIGIGLSINSNIITLSFAAVMIASSLGLLLKEEKELLPKPSVRQKPLR